MFGVDDNGEGVFLMRPDLLVDVVGVAVRLVGVCNFDCIIKLLLVLLLELGVFGVGVDDE